MANADAITLNVLTVETAKNDVVESVLDTGTVAVTLPLTVHGDLHNVLLKFQNTAAAADTMKIEILAGDKAPAYLRSLGDLTINVAQNGIAYAVIDSARFKNADGTVKIKSTPAAGKTQTLKITAIQLPK